MSEPRETCGQVLAAEFIGPLRHQSNRLGGVRVNLLEDYGSSQNSTGIGTRTRSGTPTMTKTKRTPFRLWALSSSRCSS